ncbi:MAG: FHA domain-containing protein [Anaerolineae bacterium]|jgi:pSer/pThr/pTyr-binding forkhead associated (FHA) protein|nr:FHA domain-containing protein [Anaerolineae bacterium]
MAAYGRLDVFFPDGLFKTYLLTDPNTTIGRSNTSTIPIDDETLSRYHVNITLKNSVVYIADMESENGTFIDGSRLESNTATELSGGEEIMIGDLRMIFATLDDSPTRPIEVPEETTQRVDLPDAEFYIEIADSYQTVAPGAHISTRVSITNEGEKTERFAIEVTGLPREWLRIDKTEVEIAAGKSAEITLSFKPLRRSDSRPGDYTVQIAVRRKSQPDLVLRGSVNLLVLPYSGFGMALDKSRLKAGDRFRLFLHNQGSAPLPLTISGRDLSNSHLLIKLVPNRVELAPGQRVVVQGDARPKSTRLFGDARQHSFDLLARSGDASGFLVSARAYVDEKPPLPAWSVFAFGGLGVAVIGIFLIGLLVLLRPSTATPSITQFDVSAERVAQGDPLTLSWMVLDADSVAITLNGAQVMQTDTDENNIQIDTTPFTPGPVTFGLIAMNGDQQVQETRTVEIFVPLRLLSFAYSPNPLVRYVNQTITLRWDVPQASSVRIVGLEGFSTTESIDTAFSASDELSLTGIITTADPLTVTLIAEGAGSTTPLEQTVALDVIDPQCTTAAGGVTLYDGPSTSAQVIGTIPDGGFVTVNAQDPSGAWLRVVLSGGVPGWGQLSAFRCAVTFNTRDLFRELIVPTAVLPATLPPTSTGTPTATLRPTRTLRPTFTPTPAG